MNKEDIKKSLDELKALPKKKFNQTVDLIVVLKGLNLKKPEDQLDFYHLLHSTPGKEIKIGGFVGAELIDQAKEVFDEAILVDDFPKYAKDKKAVKKLISKCDVFVAQGNIMAQVATTFGRVLGPVGKMPNPKAGCVVPPNANLKQLAERLKKTIRIQAKTMPVVQLVVGKEDGKEEDIIDNIINTYKDIMNHLAGGKNNIKKVLLKLTMSKPIKLED